MPAYTLNSTSNKSRSKINFLTISSSSETSCTCDDFDKISIQNSANEPVNQEIDETPESEIDDTYVKLRTHDEINLNESERCGYLTDRVIEACSSELARSVMPGKLVLETCILSRKNLNNIEMLQFHPYLKTVNLSRNELTSVEILGHLPFLEYLDVSHNMITTLLDFKPPLNLTYVIYSYNLIEEITSLLTFWSLIYLDLSHNLISQINGLHHMKYLNYLDLSYNRIEHLCNLNHSNLNTLRLDYNNIRTFEKTCVSGLWTNNFLTDISISHNYLNSLSVFKGVWQLNKLVVSANDIRDLSELSHLSESRYLYSFDLRENPICTNVKYRNVCLMEIGSLQTLDGEILNSTEKADVNYKYSDSREKEAMYNNAALSILAHLATPEISSAVVPCYQQVSSLIVLVGPLASKKIDLIKKIAETHKKFIRTAISYTTRPRCEHEENSKDYYFVAEDEFKKLLLDGKILCCSQKYGYHFGIGYDEIRKVSEQLGVLIMHCDLTSALQIRSKYLNCKLLLCLPRSESTHRDWLQKKFFFARWISSYVNALVLQYKTQIQRISLMLLKNTDDKSLNNYSIAPEEEAEEAEVEEEPVSIVCDEVDVIQKNMDANEKWRRAYVSEAMVKVQSVMDSRRRSILKGKPTVKPVRSVSFLALTDVTEEDQDLSLEKLATEMKAQTGAFNKRRNKKDGLDIQTERKKHEHDEIVNSSDSTLQELSTMSEQVESTMSMSLMPPDSSKSEFHIEPRSRNSIRCASEFIARASEDGEDAIYMLCQLSTVNLGPEATEVALNYFIQEQITRRKEYFSIYHNNPGLFFTMVFVDEPIEAFQKVEEAVKICVKLQRETMATKCEEKPICKDMLRDRIEMVHNLMH